MTGPGKQRLMDIDFLKQLDYWQPSSQLKTFLDAGKAPVYIGFGSMAGRNPRKLADISVEV